MIQRFFFFNDTATTEIYTLSLHDALPISLIKKGISAWGVPQASTSSAGSDRFRDRQSTRLNSSHGYTSDAVFCLKKKNRLLLERKHPHGSGRLGPRAVPHVAVPRGLIPRR